ncbi:MAG TPA: ABC transporter permease [Streptosporangiaceae bacterium]|jgi:peptide/nickel transport system permease protein|nr:ABC transporter permease [Streptosporangiaceae bacterium]
MQSPEPPVLVNAPAGLLPEGGELTSADSGNLVLREFLRNKRAMGGCAVVLLMVLFCFVGPLLYKTNQTAVNLNIANDPPGNGHPLGTDEYGIDVLGRLMVGGQSSLELGFAVAIASTVIGALYGAISGMVGGALDAVLMRVVDTLLAVPTFILLLIVASMFTLNLASIILILTVLSWPYVCRLVRAQVLSLNTREFVQASTAMGSTRTRILFRHMVPNTFNIFIVTATFAVADSIYALSALSFLGLGPPPPFADWGTMLTNGVNDLFDSYPWEVYPALIVLVITVLAFRQIGDALNDIASARSSIR